MYVYSANDIQHVDNEAEAQGFSLFALMENAGRNIFRKLTNYINKQDDIVILSGRGNNGGDGIVIARYLQEAGYKVALHFPVGLPKTDTARSEEHTSELQSRGHLVCRLLLEKKNTKPKCDPNNKRR